MQLPWVSRAEYKRALAVSAEATRHALALSSEATSKAENEARLAERLLFSERARYDRLLDEFLKLSKLATTTAMVVPSGAIPDPPTVSANDERVAVALRDREASPLKRALRPGEDE